MSLKEIDYVLGLYLRLEVLLKESLYHHTNIWLQVAILSLAHHGLLVHTCIVLLCHFDIQVMSSHLSELLVLLLCLWDLELAHLLLKVRFIILHLLIVILVLGHSEAA